MAKTKSVARSFVPAKLVTLSLRRLTNFTYGSYITPKLADKSYLEDVASLNSP